MTDAMDDNFRDMLVAAGKGIVGAVPIAGSGFAEGLGVVVKKQRLDRIVYYVRGLEARLKVVEESVRKKIFKNVDKIDFIEAGMYQSARATTHGRIDSILEIVSRGLAVDATETIRRKRFLYLLAEIDDDEVAVLNAYGQSYMRPMNDRNGLDPWDKVNRPSRPHINSSNEEREQMQLYRMGEEKLLRLGLLEKIYNLRKGEEYPEFDKMKGEFKGQVRISYLGRLLLKEMGIQIPFGED